MSGICIGGSLALSITDYLFSIARVEGRSMYPTLNSEDTFNDYILISRWYAHFSDMCPGDIVISNRPDNKNCYQIKRIIAVEGEFINTPRFKQGHILIPRGHCWLEGDNSKSSLDSNSFGPISLGLIKGKATHVIWPPSRWCKLDHAIPNNRLDINF